jgi:hypothetical protein
VLNSIPLLDIILHYITLHYITLHYFSLHILGDTPITSFGQHSEPGSSVSKVIKLRAKRPGLNSRQGRDFFLLATALSRPAMGPTQPPIQRVTRALSLSAKRPGHVSDHPHSYRAEVKAAGSYTSIPPHTFMSWSLVKHRDNFRYMKYIELCQYFRRIHSVS